VPSALSSLAKCEEKRDRTHASLDAAAPRFLR
jgi:hypothetical protein